jgi:hypothetical protein
MSRCEPSSLILSTSDLTLMIECAAVVSAATRTYPFPVSANETSIVVAIWAEERGESCGYARVKTLTGQRHDACPRDASLRISPNRDLISFSRTRRYTIEDCRINCDTHH